MKKKSITDRLLGQLPEIKLPTLSRDAEIPVYLIHNSIDPDDYFFIIDFEEFVERSTQGLFVRPKLIIWAGRDDFSRMEFASHFREVFAAEFDRMRMELMQKENGNRGLGWLNWADALTLDPVYLGKVLANFVMALGLSGGKTALSSIPVPKWVKGKSKALQIEEDIEETKMAVETALRNIEVVLHKELYEHAYRRERLGKVSGIDLSAWPLPRHVRDHLLDGKSGSWW